MTYKLTYGSDPIPQLGFWTHEDEPDEIRPDGFDAAVAEAIGEYEDNKEEPPETVVVWGYRRTVLSPFILCRDHLLEHMMERLDEEHGRPKAETKPTEAMKSAATALINVIRREYVVWNCDIVCRVEVNVALWKGNG